MPDTLRIRPDVTGLTPTATHTAVLNAYKADQELFADLWGPRGSFPTEPPVNAGRRRILERHAPAVLHYFPDRPIVYCARCSGPYHGTRLVSWPCLDFTDAAARLVDGLTPAEALHGDHP